MSTAGRANEVGSVFRVVVATYLAVHGLRGQDVPGLGLPPGTHPVSLEFETDDPTDDIVVRFSDGRSGYLSAKRRLGLGAPLRDTASGWAAQAELLEPDDMLLVAAEEFAGRLQHLQRALARRRDGLEPTNTDERVCLERVTEALGMDDPALVLDRIRVLHLHGATRGTTTQEIMGAKLDAVVAGGQGHRAVTALSDMLHRRAGQAHVSDIGEWVATLEAAGAALSETGGAAMSRAAARAVAVRRYRTEIAGAAGRIDLSLLADDLPPVVVDDLVDGLKVQASAGAGPSALLPWVRRWRRMLLVGQPGAGKSLALREIAAHCALHDDAPTPVLVSLPRLLADDPARLTIESLVKNGVESALGHGAELVQEHLVSSLRSGHAVLLCDGLDECGPRTTWVAQQLADLATALNRCSGLVVATRASARGAAARIGLPVLVLDRPVDLAETVDRILAASAEVRVAAEDRGAWLASRQRWVRDTRRAHPELLDVPLLAVLVALVSAGTTDTDLVRGRAALLHRAVEESVVRWERRRASSSASERWSPELTTKMLLDGFVVLGRLLAGTDGLSRSASVHEIVGMLRDADSWALPPSRADEVAEEVLRFWDQQVAVFVVDPGGRLTARSRVFAEIALAMWAIRQDPASLDGWLRDATTATDSDVAIALAADLDPRVAAALLKIGEDGRSEAVVLLAELATTSVVRLSEADLRRLLGLLRDLVVQLGRTGSRLRRQSAQEPSGLERVISTLSTGTGPWDVVESACTLQLPASCRDVRSELVRSAGLDGDA